MGFPLIFGVFESVELCSAAVCAEVKGYHHWEVVEALSDCGKLDVFSNRLFTGLQNPCIWSLSLPFQLAF